MLHRLFYLERVGGHTGEDAACAWNFLGTLSVVATVQCTRHQGSPTADASRCSSAELADSVSLPVSSLMPPPDKNFVGPVPARQPQPSRLIPRIADYGRPIHKANGTQAGPPERHPKRNRVVNERVARIQIASAAGRIRISMSSASEALLPRNAVVGGPRRALAPAGSNIELRHGIPGLPETAARALDLWTLVRTPDPSRCGAGGAGDAGMTGF